MKKTIPNLKKKYREKVLLEMRKIFGYKNALQAPRLVKVVLNIGLSQGIKDPKYVDVALDTLKRVTGQQPVKTVAKKSISNFKIRKGMVVGAMVTLRGNRMYEFVDKLINITFPRVRDFRGIAPSIVDRNGNCTVGFKEHLAFPEIRPDEVEKLHGLEITVVTTAKTKEEGRSLLKTLGFPFREK